MTGLGAQVGLAAEASYGTYKAPNRFYEFTSEAPALRRGRQELLLASLFCAWWLAFALLLAVMLAVGVE